MHDVKEEDDVRANEDVAIGPDDFHASDVIMGSMTRGADVDDDDNNDDDFGDTPREILGEYCGVDMRSKSFMSYYHLFFPSLLMTCDKLLSVLFIYPHLRSTLTMLLTLSAPPSTLIATPFLPHPLLPPLPVFSVFFCCWVGHLGYKRFRHQNHDFPALGSCLEQTLALSLGNHRSEALCSIPLTTFCPPLVIFGCLLSIQNFSARQP